MTCRLCGALSLTIALACAAPASAAFLIEIDTDGDPDNGAVTFNPNFSFGGDTTTASASAAANAVGLTPANSIFGGDGTALPDTYQYSYTPGTDGDNLELDAGTALNDDGDVASGLVAGGAMLYNVYAAWPITNNVSGGDTLYELSDGEDTLFSNTLDQNTVNGFVDPANGMTFAGGEWVLVGSAVLDPDTTYTVIQQPSESNSFVSMRAAGVLFEPVPEPGAIGLVLSSAAGLLALRRRR